MFRVEILNAGLTYQLAIGGQLPVGAQEIQAPLERNYWHQNIA